MMYRLVIWAIGLCVAGCGAIVPAQTPPQLAATPGEFVTVTKHSVEARSFTFAYPYGWRIVKSNPAGEPLQFIIIAPDETQLIAVGEAEYTLPASDRTYQRHSTITAGSAVIYVAGDSVPEQRAAFDATFDFVTSSVKPAS